MKASFIFVLCIVLGLVTSCKDSKEKTVTELVSESPSACMERVLKEDEAHGTERNHASETISLGKTITNYTQRLRGMDFGNCPEAFELAFYTHSQAWDSLVPIANRYPDLRGELHSIFDTLEQSQDSTEFKRLLALVWSTWENVEAAQK